MQGGQAMKVSEFIKLIKENGAKFEGHGSRHDIYINPKTGQTTQVPRHQSKELGNGIKESMLKGGYPQ